MAAWDLAATALVSVAAFTPAAVQDGDIRRWQGFEVQPLSDHEPDWVYELERRGPYYTIWIDDMVARYTAGAMSDYELLRILWDEKPDVMNAVEQYSYGGKLDHVTPKLLRDLVTAQGFGPIALRDSGEPIFFDDRKLTDENGEIVEGRERDYAAAVTANRIATGRYLLAAAIRAGEQPSTAALPGGGVADQCLRIDPAVPESINSEDIRQWADAMHLSEEQRTYLASLHERYLHEDEELRQVMVEPIVSEWQGISAGHRAPTSDEAADEVAALLASARTLVMQMIAIEQEMIFEQLLPALTQEQVPVLGIVRDRRMRSIFRSVGTCLPGAEVDLATIVMSFGRDPDVLWSDVARGQESLRAYEHGLTELLRQVHDARREWMVQMPGLVQHQRTQPSGQERTQRRIDDLRERVFAAEQAVIDHQETFVQLIGTLLNQRFRDRFVQQCDEALYPAGFPNPFDISALGDQVTSSNVLSDEQAQSIEEITRMTAVQLRELSITIGRISRQHERELHERFTIDFDERMEHARHLDALHQERREVAERAIESMMGVFLDEVPAAVAQAIEAFRARAMESRPRITGMRYSPAAPPQAKSKPPA